MEHNEPGGTGCPADSAYLLDNAGREASARFSALAATLDPGTVSAHLEVGSCQEDTSATLPIGPESRANRK